jgi:lysophospholipase L1-like esterase
MSVLAAEERQITVMPLGDSITAGWPDLRYGGYRRRLAALLAKDGYKVRFVGSQRNGAGIASGPANEGHVGWTIEELKAGIDAHRWLETYRPDIILLHIGTNDLARGGAGSAAAANLQALVEDILTRLPAARVIVAQIVAFKGAPNKAYDEYVSAIPGIAKRDGRRVTAVDMRTLLTARDFTDALHPNRRGYDKIAAAWDAAIRGVLRPKPLTNRPL